MSSRAFSSDSPSWDYEGRDWPNREASRFVTTEGLRWHVQEMGRGPVLLLLHGTGAATHSWRGLLPLLAERFRVIAPDLPGHGFTQSPPPRRLSLTGMAADLDALLKVLDVRPTLVAGHSAGAAILLHMCLAGQIAPRSVVSINGALQPFRGAAGHLFSPIAKTLAGSSLMPQLLAWRATSPRVVERLIRNTGSRLEPEGLALYGRLIQKPSHIAAALNMMANWDLVPLDRDLHRLETRLLLVVGARDRTIPPSQAREIQARVRRAALRSLRGLGHLAHEERPQEVADILIDELQEPGPPDEAPHSGGPGDGASKGH